MRYKVKHYCPAPILRVCPFVCTHVHVHVVFSFRLCETVVPLEDPIITETTSTLQEWGVLWKQLYVVSITAGLTNMKTKH